MVAIFRFKFRSATGRNLKMGSMGLSLECPTGRDLKMGSMGLILERNRWIGFTFNKFRSGSKSGLLVKSKDGFDGFSVKSY